VHVIGEAEERGSACGEEGRKKKGTHSLQKGDGQHRQGETETMSKRGSEQQMSQVTEAARGRGSKRQR
jgi:hypothetical protein